uniref:Zinc finger CCCH domain-containing protein 18 n=1 Tax=Cacopsylla melanoneura TaxID=428564 RepID=A0A8D8UTW6_9HEMI
MNGGVTMSLAVTDEEQLDFDEDPTDETNLPGAGTMEREEGEDEDGELPGDKPNTGGGADGGEKRGGGGAKKEEEELEEGEVSDEGECRPEENEPRPICRFYSRGACTWGSSCRFLHPGVTDKGHYTMFDMIRPLTAPAPPHHAAPYHPGASMRPADPYGAPAMLDPRVPGAGVSLMRGPPGKEEHGSGAPVSATAGGAPVTESAWERGLRQAKEILKKSTKRKETEVDFEEKKMNLTLGQDELDKENDYYTRSASPALSPSPERVLPAPRTKTQGHPPHYLPPGDDYLPPHGHPGADPYYRPPMHHVDPYYMHHRPLPPPHHPYDDPHRVYARPRYGAPHPDYYAHPGAPPPREGHLPPHDLVYEPSSRGPPGSKPSSASSSRHAKPAREVIVQRVEKSVPHRSGVPEYDGPPSAGGVPGDRGPRGGSIPSRRESPPVRRARADEWADPWMRSKSPGRERDGGRDGGGRGGGGGGEGREGGGGKRGRRSSESSYSSSSSRSSSSRSSYSSYSDSRSRSRSPRNAPRSSRAPPPPARKPPIQFKLSPSSRNKVLPSRGKPASPPSGRMSNKQPKLPFAAASPADNNNRRGPPGSTHNSTGGSTGGVPPRLLAQAKATVKEALRFSSRRRGSSRSRSSSASSSASSSSSSSSSEEDSSSGDSSSGSATPPPRGTKKGAPHVSKKAATAAPSGGGRAKTPLSPPKKKPSSGAGTDLNKLAGTKAGIKLNLASDKAGGGGGAGKKRPAPDDSSPNKTPPPPSKKSSGGVPSRREELLKQLKAVEDAIARKRSKI